MKIFRRHQFESEMETELGFHIQAYIEDLVRSGMDPAEAQRRARVEFGAVEATKDECRQAWGLQRLDDLRADLRYTFRALRQNPLFSSIAILSLAIGIGANTAIFGLVDAVMLRLLPVRDPGRLVFIQNVGSQGANGGPPYPCFELFRDMAHSFEEMAAFSRSNMEIGINGDREQVRGVYVSGNFYSMLAIKPLMGRALSAADDQTVGKGGPDGPVAVISRAFWRQRFGGNPAVLGTTIRLFDSTATIVGIMPSEVMSLEPGRPIDIAVPMMLSDPASLRDRGAWWLDVVARLKPGIQAERARAESDALFQGFMTKLTISPDIRRIAFDHIELAPAGAGMDSLRKTFSKPLTALLILAGLVLLAACVTVANLMLARATARQKEFAVRLAIGAGRGRLIRQTLTEALVLVGVGATLGTILALRGESALAAYFAEGNNQIILDLSMSGRVLLYTLAVSILTGVAFGLLPALRAARVDPAAGMQASSRSLSGSRSSLRLGRALVALQVGLSMVLLAGAGLFIHSLRQLESVDLGFTRQGILTMDVAPERALFGSQQWLTLQTEILNHIRRMPGVRSAAWSTMTPLNGRDRGEVLDVPGFSPRIETDRHVHLVAASPEYVTTLGIPLLLGRTFTERDGANAPKVAMINETTARFYFGDANPIGRKMVFATIQGTPTYEVVGVVKDSKHQSLRGKPWRFLFIPIQQAPDRINRLTLSVRCSNDAMASAAPAVKQILGTRSGLLITNISTIERQVQFSLMKERLVSTLSTAFGALALILACIGLYGVLAYGVTRRTGEIGIRMALGATRGEMVGMVLKEAIRLAAIGIVLGIPPVLALGRVSSALLYGVGAFDVPAFTIAVAVLLTFAVFAGIAPAFRAGRLDPASALRCG
ncbi:MAG TPA: ABC transporter permease [Bryobacteraceae bacterium]|nr:ABC transporter permease [Bryobacteraceae bacterium]